MKEIEYILTDTENCILNDSDSIYTICYTKQGVQCFTMTQWYNRTVLDFFFHREDGPAWINKKGEMSYYINNTIHREDGPAIIRTTFKKWMMNGKCHRTDGPACIWRHNNNHPSRELYYINDNRHRIDGPAEIWYKEDGTIEGEFYYINGKEYRKEDYHNLINEMKALPKSLKLTHQEQWVREL